MPLVYFPRNAVQALFRQYFFYGRGRAMTVALHGRSGRIRQVAPLAVAPMAALALLAPFYWPMIVPAAVWAAICLCYGVAIGLRRGTCELATGAPAMIMHLAWSLGYWSHLLFGITGRGRLNRSNLSIGRIAKPGLTN